MDRMGGARHRSGAIVQLCTTATHAVGSGCKNRRIRHHALPVYTEVMQLSTARLCLDCDEVHEAQKCPVCASESFSYMSRWVPAPERRPPPRPTTSPEAEIYRRLVQPPPPSRGKTILTNGVLGLTAVGLVGWFVNSRRKKEEEKEA
jgi:hypothetical protein